jgi:hypothetical protein
MAIKVEGNYFSPFIRDEHEHVFLSSPRLKGSAAGASLFFFHLLCSSFLVLYSI